MSFHKEIVLKMKVCGFFIFSIVFFKNFTKIFAQKSETFLSDRFEISPNKLFFSNFLILNPWKPFTYHVLLGKQGTLYNLLTEYKNW